MNSFAKTFTLVGLVVVILLALHFLSKTKVGDTDLRRVSVLNDVLPDVDETGEESDSFPMSLDESTTTAEANASVPAVDTPEAETVVETPHSVPAAAADGTTPILDYSKGQPGGMYYFYRQLSRAKEMGRPVRVAYYGDSFIEGDIFTSDLRRYLQEQFGGSGVGWVDCASKVSGFRPTIAHTFNGLKEFEVMSKPFTITNQGIAQRYFTVADGANITYKNPTAKRFQSEWEKSVFYLRTDGGLSLKTIINDDSTLVESVKGSPNLQAITHRADGGTMQSVSYTVNGIQGGTLLYGVALEPERGVVVDNFSMRGSSGGSLSQIPSAMLGQFAAMRPYDLIVVHYGLNVASSKQTNYQSYIQQMGQAIDHLRQAYPQASFLVVSMPDRDQRTGSGLSTMKGVEALVNYQKLMASEHSVCFFNLFEAMGGKDSMKKLVDKKQANKDFTHINFAGGKYLAGLLYQSMMSGYHSYGF